MERESKEYSWAWITDDSLLSHGPCELVYFECWPSNTNMSVYVYDGESAVGEVIVKVFSATKRNYRFSPKVPVYCRRGLYVNFDEKIGGMFVQWREL
jgi:hypothetical protein